MERGRHYSSTWSGRKEIPAGTKGRTELDQPGRTEQNMSRKWNEMGSGADRGRTVFQP